MLDYIIQYKLYNIVCKINSTFVRVYHRHRKESQALETPKRPKYTYKLEKMAARCSHQCSQMSITGVHGGSVCKSHRQTSGAARGTTLPAFLSHGVAPLSSPFAFSAIFSERFQPLRSSLEVYPPLPFPGQSHPCLVFAEPPVTRIALARASMNFRTSGNCCLRAFSDRICLVPSFYVLEAHMFHI